MDKGLPLMSTIKNVPADVPIFATQEEVDRIAKRLRALKVSRLWSWKIVVEKSKISHWTLMRILGKVERKPLALKTLRKLRVFFQRWDRKNPEYSSGPSKVNEASSPSSIQE